ncbi:uncharacterized protein LOC128882966 isoform X2 [Hylaeus volcanicus]|uniref:uncharacterized protein LOC128882966 isoform X2 n=1 Tax=Hylaeus volcanicus TaxID=313075 RepID=UPI0023B7F1E4|nr:uncharacterized protein LOC128882966 isoform X2 [Hylaeus volcanicus]
MNDNGIYCSPENVALQNSSSHVQSFNSSCREFRSSDGHETLYAPYGVPSWMIKEMVPLYEKPNTRFLQPQCKLNQKNQMHRQSPVFMQHENAEDSTLNHSTLYKENAIWSDSSFGESQTKMEPVLSKKQSLVFNTDSYETSISPVVPKFKFLKKGSRNPFINVPKNEKNGFRYNSVLDSDHLNKNKVQNKVTQHKEFSFLSKSPRIDKEKMLTASGTTTSSNGETTTSSYAKTLCFPCTTEQNQTLKENRRKSYASPRWSEHVFTGQERNDNVSSKTKKTDTKCYDISEIPKTDAEGYDTSETKKTDIAPVTKKVGSNKCIIEKCLRGNRDILSGSELPLKHHKCPTYDRSCLSLPRLSEVMLGQSSGVRATRSVSPRIQPNNRRIMTPGGNTGKNIRKC